MTIRCFLAFPISSGLKEKLGLILNDLQHTCADVKWVKLENIHLTLKFLGSLEERDLENISSLLEERCRSFDPITSHLSEIGAFPDLHHPKIVWVALDDPTKHIHEIVNVIEADLAKWGLAKEENIFKSHITLGRVRSPTNLKELIQAMLQITFEEKIKHTFDRIILYKSTLMPQGPIYEVLKEFKMLS